MDNTVFAQRYSGQGQAVGGRATVAGLFRAPANAAVTFTLAADLQAGDTVGLRIPNAAFPARTTASAVHVAATNIATQIVALRIGHLLLLPLETGFVLFTSNDLGAFEQRLDSEGVPTGIAVRIELFPVDAREIADGSYVVFFLSGGQITAQRFDAGGTEMGDLLTVPSLGVVPGIAALTGGGFALAWMAPGSAATTTSSRRSSPRPTSPRAHCWPSEKPAWTVRGACTASSARRSSKPASFLIERTTSR